MTGNERGWHVLYALEALQAQYGYGNVPAVVMLAQSALETANWTSNLVVNHNNAFGMQLPLHRPTTNNGFVIAESGKKFCTYATLQDSVADYFLRQFDWNVPNTNNVDDYMAATVATGYGADPLYLTKWDTRLSQLNAGGLGTPPPEVGPMPPPSPGVDPAPPPPGTPPATAQGNDPLITGLLIFLGWKLVQH